MSQIYSAGLWDSPYDATVSLKTPRDSAEKPDTPRKRGRPPRTIDRDELIKAVERLFVEGGIEAVSIERTAQEIDVSRATLYRTVPSKEALLGILFDNLTERLDRRAHEISETEGLSPRETLRELIRIQCDAAVQMREYLFVFFGGGWLPSDVYGKWRKWRHGYEAVWRETVERLIEAGDLPAQDPFVATRLIVGMTIWVSQWYRPADGVTAEEIADEAIRLLHCD